MSLISPSCIPTFKFSDDGECFSVSACSVALLNEANPLIQMDDDSSVGLTRAFAQQIRSCDSVIEIEAPNDIDISREPLCEVFRAAALRKAHVREWLRVSVMPNMGQVAAAKTMLELLKFKNSMTQFRAAAHVGHQRHCTARA